MSRNPSNQHKMRSKYELVHSIEEQKKKGNKMPDGVTDKKGFRRQMVDGKNARHMKTTEEELIHHVGLTERTLAPFPHSTGAGGGGSSGRVLKDSHEGQS
jgi:hypothetical protein